MDGFAGRQHRDKFRDSSRPGLGLLCILDAIKDREAIDPIQAFKKTPGLGVWLQRYTKIIGNLRRALRRIGSPPTSILLRPFDLLHAGGQHPSQLDQFKRAAAISFRPLAGLTARREADERILVVKAIELAVDSAVTKRGIDGFRF